MDKNTEKKWDAKKIWKRIQRSTLYQLFSVLVFLGVCAGIGIGFAVIDTESNPDTVAENYMKNYISGNWSNMYSMLELPKSQYLTEESFTTVMYQQIENTRIIDYKLGEGKKEKGKMVYKIKCKTMDANGNEGKQVVKVSLNKKVKHWYSLICDWKVDAGDMVVTGLKVKTVQGLDLYFDGNKLSPREGKEEDGALHYFLTATFKGKHTFTLRNNYVNSQELNQTISSDKQELDLTTSQLVANDTYQTAIDAFHETTIQKFYKNAMKKKKIREVLEDFPKEKTIRADVKEAYNKILKQLFPYAEEEVYTTNKFEIYDFTYLHTQNAGQTYTAPNQLVCKYKMYYHFDGANTISDYDSYSMSYSGDYKAMVKYTLTLNDDGSVTMTGFKMSFGKATKEELDAIANGTIDLEVEQMEG